MCPILLKHWAKIHLYSKAVEDTTWWGDSCCYYRSIQILHPKSPILGLTPHTEYKIKSRELWSEVFKMKISYKCWYKKIHSIPINNNPLAWFIIHGWQYWGISSLKPLCTFYRKEIWMWFIVQHHSYMCICTWQFHPTSFSMTVSRY